MELIIALVLFVGIVVSWFALPGVALETGVHAEQAGAPTVTVRPTA